MNISESNQYHKDIKKSKIELSAQIKKVLDLLIKDATHPSLHNKHIACKRADNLFSIRVTKQYRILYLKYADDIELHRLLDHDKYDRLIKNC